ncbi:MAG TPA: DUF89 family protein [Thermofilaceae archaeon]|nr:DUF89 family protein [Thermofilaceae archaeon]
MRIWPCCIPCIYGVRAREVLESSLDWEEKVYALARLHKFMSRASEYSSTIRLASDAFRLVKRLIRDPDPYREYKERSDRLVREELLPLLEKEIARLRSYEKFQLLAVASIGANVLDPGVPGYGNLKPLLDVRLGLDESGAAYELLCSSRRVAYLLDNAGEALVDLLLVKELAEMGVEVVVLAKSFPYQNDVTVEEAVSLGFGEVAEVVGTSSDCAGPLPGELSEEALKALLDSDVVVAKGMAAYEALLEWRLPRPVIHMFKAKCQPVASSAGVRVGEGVIMVRHIES